jgi:hypothetical protein
MTGRTWREVVEEAADAVDCLENHGIEVYSPALDEWKRQNNQSLWRQKIGGGLEALKAHWKRDKDEIVRSHAMLDLTPHRHSQGVAHEIGFHRYALWKPVLRKMDPTSSVAMLEDDLLVPTVEDAAREINLRWGTRWLRWKWRSRMLIRTLPKWLWRQVLAWS